MALVIDGADAARLAGTGVFVIAGLSGANHKPARNNGHVAVVISGKLYKEKYPVVWCGSTGGAQSQGDKTVGEVWNRTDRDSVVYYSYTTTPASNKYPRLSQLIANATSANAEAIFKNQVVPYLVEVWLSDYERTVKGGEIVETPADGFSYLFDITAGRLIAAWGISKGRYAGPRDTGRMSGHPKSEGPHYHRGHAIPHTLGGPTDINLVPQLGSVNIGPFRVLEIRAVATPGALYFTYWTYTSKNCQRPSTVDQGLLVPGQSPEIRVHAN